MDQNTAARYHLFRTAGVREVLKSLSQSDLGRKVIYAVKEYHGRAKDVEKIPLPPDQVGPLLAHQLAWKFFDEHDATPEKLKSKLERMMRRYNMSSTQVYAAYAGRVYTEARARLVLRDLRSRGTA